MAESDFSELDLNLCLQTAIELAREAGDVINEAIAKDKKIATKASRIDFVTETDKMVEALLKEGFLSQFPSHKFIGEETTSETACSCELTDSPTWIIDPVDGTMNFVHGFPFVAVSIGLAYKKEIVLGVVFNPILNDMFTAMKGSGAFCNGKQLHVSEMKELSQALIGVELGTNRSPEKMNCVFKNLTDVVAMAHGMRACGSAALNMCLVASGRLDAYYEYGPHCWDMAAGKIIVEEAGGVVIDTEGGPLNLMDQRILCAGTSELAQSLSSKLFHIRTGKD